MTPRCGRRLSPLPGVSPARSFPDRASRELDFQFSLSYLSSKRPPPRWRDAIEGDRSSFVVPCRAAPHQGSPRRATQRLAVVNGRSSLSIKLLVVDAILHYTYSIARNFKFVKGKYCPHTLLTSIARQSRG